ncbi:MAG: serine/threonine-protein kinase, partial [Polyangiaceae bacterium]
IVHRDLKPANLFLAQRPNRAVVIKVLDFGISKATNMGSARNSALTDAMAVMGSPLYMSPEQLRATRDVDARADIWALGVTLYELLAGVSPFHAETVAMVCVNILNAAPEPFRARRSDVPPALEAIVLRCLEKDRDRRFGSITELVQALQPFAGGAQVSAASPMRSTTSSVGAVGVTAPTVSPPADHRRPLVIALGVVMFVVLALLAGSAGIYLTIKRP